MIAQMDDQTKYDLVRSLCKKFAQPNDELDDLVHDMWLEIHDVEPISHVIVKTRTRLIDRYRKRKRYSDRFVSDELVHAEPEQDPNTTQDTKDQLNQIIKRAQLTSHEREILYLRHYVGLDFRQMSQQLKIGTSNVHGQYHQILAKIRLANELALG